MLITDGGGAYRATQPQSDRQRIRVEIAVDGTPQNTTLVGSAEAALSSSKLTKQERAAVRNVLEGMRLLRASVGTSAPIDDALNSVERIVLRVDKSPAAGSGQVLVPPSNPLKGLARAKTTNALMPMDVALHELTHLVQESTSGATIGSRGGRETRGMGGAQNFDAISVAEGLADAGAALSLETWRSGSAYFTKSSPVHAVRDYDHPTAGNGVLSELRTTYSGIRHREADPHVEGGLVGELFHDIATDTSYAQASIALRGVLSDEVFRASNQDWFPLRDALLAQADAAHARRDERLATAIIDALDDAGFPR